MTPVVSKPLKDGDQICIVDPANAFPEEGIGETIACFSGEHLQVVQSEDMAFKHGSPEERADKLNEVIRDPKNRGIFCFWGGYGTMTLLEFIDYEALRKNRPAFVGMSDITALHLAIQEQADLMTFHGPSLYSKKRPTKPEALRELLDVLRHPMDQRTLQNLDGSPFFCLHAGNFTGRITGGNLTLLCRLMGTKYEMDTRGKVLFFEEVGEKPYRIHGLLTQLKLAGKLEQAAGILVGSLTDCDLPDRPGSAMEAVQNVLEDVPVPVIYNVRAGHVSDALTIPLNAVATVKNEGEISLQVMAKDGRDEEAF